jgi:hypothetical protein
MRHERYGGNRPLWLGVHRTVIRLAVGATIWTIAAVWILFSHSYYGILLFGVVSFLVAMFMLLPWVLSHFARKTDNPDEPATFREWRSGEFDTASGPMKGSEAAVLILLIPMAVAVGMTAIGFLEFLTAEGVL